MLNLYDEQLIKSNFDEDKSSKNKITKMGEINKFDQIINKNINSMNDVLNRELKSTNNYQSVKEPTPVSYFTVLKRTKVVQDGLYVLFDSGSSHSIVARSLVEQQQWKRLREPAGFDSCNGAFNLTYKSKVTLSLSELNSHRIIDWQCFIDDRDNGELGYDMIIGRDLMTELGLILNFNEKKIIWDGIELEMRDFNSKKPSRKEIKRVMQQAVEPTVTKNATSRMIKILDSNYEKADLHMVVQQAKHINSQQQEQLYQLLKKYEEIFDGKLSKWDTEPVDFEFVEGAQPHSLRHFPVPHIHKETFKKELLRLVEIGVLEKVHSSEWGSPTFIIPKKNGTVRFISDFRKLNKMLKRKPYPLPRIADLLQNLSGFTHATALDLSMGYYSIELSTKSSDACTIVTEFGKFRYKRLPMGVSCSPDIFQAKINELLGDIEGICAYLDDLLLLSKGSWEDHLERLEEVLQRLKQKGLRVNPLKSFFGINEIEYLGYIISQQGIKPQAKKVQAILDIERPTTTTELRRLIGMVNYYRDLWKGRSHILGPLTEMASGKKNKKIPWKPEHEKAFQDVKRLVAQETVLAYPDWTKPFEIHSDASDYQLGAVLSQDGRPLSFSSRKLTSPQKIIQSQKRNCWL